MIWLLYANILTLITLTSYGHRELNHGVEARKSWICGTLWELFGPGEAQIQPFQRQLQPPMALATEHLAVHGMSGLARRNISRQQWSVMTSRILMKQLQCMNPGAFELLILRFTMWFLAAKINFLRSSRSLDIHIVNQWHPSSNKSVPSTLQCNMEPCHSIAPLPCHSFSSSTHSVLPNDQTPIEW